MTNKKTAYLEEVYLKNEQSLNNRKGHAEAPILLFRFTSRFILHLNQFPRYLRAALPKVYEQARSTPQESARMWNAHLNIVNQVGECYGQQDNI